MYTPGLTGSKQPLRVCRESLTLVSVSQDQPNMNENTLESWKDQSRKSYATYTFIQTNYLEVSSSTLKLS